MRRADRLFQIIQILRGGRVVTAATLAAELEVSERTIYRDVRDLIGSGVPVEGEAGVGYMLSHGFELPPLMFTPEEIETLVLGARMVESWAGPAFARRARSVLAKAESALPEELRDRLREVDLYAPGFHVKAELTRNLDPIRQALSEQRKLRFDYENRGGEATSRTIRPLGLYFWGKAWTALGWCELREDFRNFRPDRMTGLEVLDEAIPDEPGRDLATFMRDVIGIDPE